MHFYIRSESVVSRLIAGETLIVPVRKGVGDLASIFSLNEVGSAIWQAISQPRSKDEIVAWVGREFEGDHVQIEIDVTSFLAEMTSAGLVTAASLASAGACE